MPLPLPPACAGCPAQASGWGRGYVPGCGPQNAQVAFVGQGPGEQEHWAGTPFVGPSGVRFNGWLAKAGFQRSAVWVDNVVRCWLPKSVDPAMLGNRPPTPAEVAHCTRVHLSHSLAALPNLRLVITVGMAAADWGLGRVATMDDAGTVGDLWLPFPLASGASM